MGSGGTGEWGMGQPGNQGTGTPGNGEWKVCIILKADTVCGSYNSMSNFIEAFVLLYVKLIYTVFYDWCSYINFDPARHV